MSEEKKEEIKQPEGTIPASDNGKDKPKVEAKVEPPTDFKIAEIWVRSGQIMLDAAPNFWQDRCRALGVLLLCQDIVKTAKMPENKIIPVKGSLINGIRNMFNKNRRN